MTSLVSDSEPSPDPQEVIVSLRVTNTKGRVKDGAEDIRNECIKVGDVVRQSLVRLSVQVIEFKANSIPGLSPGHFLGQRK